MNPSIVLNVLLNLFFLLVLKMTTHPVQVKRKYFQFDLTVFKRILQIGLPTGLQSAVFAIANIAVQSGLYHLCRTELRSRKHRTFETVMLAYPISLGLAAICFICLNDQSIFTLDSLHSLTRCQKRFIIPHMLT